MRVLRSGLVRDALLGLAVVAAAELELLTVDPGEVDGSVAGLHLLSLALLPAFTIRRVSPVGAVGVVALAFAYQPLLGSAPVAVPFLALLFLLASLGWYAGTAAGALGVGLTLLAAVPSALIDGSTPADLVVNATVVVAAWGSAHLVRIATDRRVAAEVEADRAARDAVAGERERISRDLHDSLGHALTLITLHAGGAREGTRQPQDRTAFEYIEHAGREALVDLHRFLELLGPGEDEAPGLAHLPQLVEGVRGQGIDVDLAVAADGLPASVETTVYRVVQEGLTNVVRHSAARRAVVEVRREPGEVRTTVRDDGHAVTTRVPSSGRGLVGLRERLGLFHGTLEYGDTPSGWLLEARIPLGGA